MNALKKTILMSVAALSATVLALGATQTVPQAGEAPTETAGETSSGQGASSADEALWRARLTTPDLEQREEQFEALVDELSRGESELLGLVESWRESGGELGWTARLALRAARASRQPVPALPAFPGQGFDPFGSGAELMRQMEALRGGLLGADPFGGPFGDPFGGPFGGQSLFGVPTPGALGGALPGASGGSSHSSQLSIESGPDGVRVEVIEDSDGDESSRVYEAETLEELLQAHPELSEQLAPMQLGFSTPGQLPWGGQQGRRAPLGFGSMGSRDEYFEAPWGSSAGGGDAQPLGDARAERLGIVVRPLSPAEPHGDAEHGLYIERVQGHSLGHALGLKRGDVLLALDGLPVRGPEDVRRVLQERPLEQPLEALILDAGAERNVLTWDPASSADELRTRSGSGRRI